MVAKTLSLFGSFAVVVGVAGCTSSAGTPEVRDQSYSCEATKKPARFEVVIDDARATVPSSMPLVMATAEHRAPYLVEVHGHTCGERAYFAYNVTRVSNQDDAAAVLLALGPPPGVTLPVTSPSRPAQQLEGMRDVAVGEVALLGEGTWPDGEAYRISVKAF